jgi:hypothetical protein
MDGCDRHLRHKILLLYQFDIKLHHLERAELTHCLRRPVGFRQFCVGFARAKLPNCKHLISSLRLKMLFWRLCLLEPQMKAEPSVLHFWFLARNEK